MKRLRLRVTARWRLAAGLMVGWLLLATLWGAQRSLGSAVSGEHPIALLPSVRSAVRQVLPWIPVTFAIVSLSLRVPITRAKVWSRAAFHVASSVLMAWIVNMLVVLDYWMGSAKFDGVVELMRQGVIWGAVNLHVALLMYAFILGTTQTLLFYRTTQARELQVARLADQLSRARLQALHAQIRPHFLFNTLHTIGQLWRIGRHDDADAVLDHLGALFHKVQHSTSHFEVPLTLELELVRDYLFIEGVRFRDRLVYSVVARGDVSDCFVPPLILQPIVENAVRHGVSTVSATGRVEVTAERDGARLRLAVRDDGPGIHGRPQRPGTGTGLRNTRERLVELYGSDATLDVNEVAEGGTLVTIDLPAMMHGLLSGDTGNSDFDPWSHEHESADAHVDAR